MLFSKSDDTIILPHVQTFARCGGLPSRGARIFFLDLDTFAPLRTQHLQNFSLFYTIRSSPCLQCLLNFWFSRKSVIFRRDFHRILSELREIPDNCQSQRSVHLRRLKNLAEQDSGSRAPSICNRFLALLRADDFDAPRLAEGHDRTLQRAEAGGAPQGGEPRLVSSCF